MVHQVNQNIIFHTGMYTYKVNPANEYVLVETAPGWELIKLLLMEGKTKCYSAWNI